MAKKFEVTILGVNSAYPVHGRHPSCQVVNYNDHLFMIDCGEGSQIQLSKYKIKRSKISNIFITHLHGDHCFGLPGLLTSYSLQGRKDDLTIHGPEGIKSFINHIFSTTRSRISYRLNIVEYNTEMTHTIEISPDISVSTFPLKHRIPTMGFRVDEHILELNIDVSSIEKYNLNIDEIKAIKKGEDLERDGNVILNEKLTLPKNEERSYAYCSDTLYNEDMIQHIAKCNLIYHETTYLDDLVQLATDRGHTTLGQAIKIAKKANINRMIIGHFSSRYADPTLFLTNGKPLFEGLILGEEGKTYDV